MIDAQLSGVWGQRLRTVSQRALGDNPIVPAAGTFRDERGNALEIDEPFFAALRGEVLAPVSGPSGGPLAGDVAIWRGVDPRSVLIEPDNTGDGPLPLLTNYDPMGTGGTIAQIEPGSSQPSGPRNGKWVTIEVLTERELCALHGLHRAGRRLAEAGDQQEAHWAKARCRRACLWLIEHLQPDNATNYPWGLHVMLMQEPAMKGLGDHYAQTLLHNCQAGSGLGRADVRSAWILYDAASDLARM